MRKGQMTLSNVIIMIITLAGYLLVGLPMVVAFVNASGLTGLNKLIAEAFPFFILLGILKLIFDYSTPARDEYYNRR